MSETKIPRMRTIGKAIAEIKAADPGSGISEYRLRAMVKTGAIPAVYAGNKALVNLDVLLEMLCAGASGVSADRDEPVSGIRPIDPGLR